MQHVWPVVVIALLVLSGAAMGEEVRCPTCVWPISGSSVSHEPQSSPFGPRLKASEGQRYDFHRGVDIPAPLRTPMYAVEAGVVRLATDDEPTPAYSDKVVQIRHFEGTENEFFSLYVHCNDTTPVWVGKTVAKGDLVAFSGLGAPGWPSGFPHLHFEIRTSFFQRDSENPYRWLPYDDTVSHSITSLRVAPETGSVRNVSLTTSFADMELDFVSVKLQFFDTAGNELAPSLVGAQNNTLNIDVLNHETTVVLDLDNPYQRGVLISPARFNVAATACRYNFTFVDRAFPDGTTCVQVSVIDARDNAVTQRWGACASPPPPPPPPPPPVSPDVAASSGSQTTAIAVGVGVSMAVLLIAVAVAVVWWCRARHPRASGKYRVEMSIYSSTSDSSSP